MSRLSGRIARKLSPSIGRPRKTIVLQRMSRRSEAERRLPEPIADDPTVSPSRTLIAAPSTALTNQPSCGRTRA
jgi:hypothetical protein